MSQSDTIIEKAPNLVFRKLPENLILTVLA
jgi:hypothetical protein